MSDNEISEKEFEEGFMPVLINEFKNSLDSNYELLLDSLLDEFRDYTLIFNDEERNNYNIFINNLKSYIIILQTIDSLINDVDIIVNNYMKSNKNDIGKYFFDLISNKSNIDFFSSLSKLPAEYNDFIQSKIENLINSFSKTIINVINNKSYLLNVDSNEINKIIDDICKIFERNDYNGIINDVDIDTLILLLNDGKYNIVLFVDDFVFNKLPKEYVIKLIKNIDDSYNCIYSNYKKKYILNIIGIKDFFEITNYSNYEYFYQVIDDIDDELLEFIINNKKYEGIEKYKPILNNKKYIKKLINNGYDQIFDYLSIDIIDDEILDNVNCNVCLFKYYLDGNLSNLLLNNKIFLKFSQNIYDHVELLYKVREENITREMVLFCMLDGMKLEDDMSDKIKKYYNRSLDDIKYALSKGYKCSSSTIELTKEEVLLFINNGDPNVINYIKNNNILTMDLIKSAIKMGYKMDRGLLNNLEYNLNYQEKILDLLNYSIDNNYDNFYSSLLFIEENLPIINKKLLEIYKEDEQIISFLNFRISDFHTYYSLKQYLNINSIKDIRKYFNNIGINDNLYNEILFMPQLLRNFVYSYNLLNHFKNDPIIQNYINFSINRYQLKLNNKEEIYKYFNESGPSKNLYDLALITPSLFIILSKDYEIVYKDNLSILNYIKFYFKYGMILNSKEEIYKYFNESGPSDSFYEDVLFSNNNLYLNILINDYDMINKYTNNPAIQYYIKFSQKYSSNIFEFINKDNVSQYFSNLGVTNKLKQYMAYNPSYAKNKILLLAHNNQVLNNIDEVFISIFKYYIIDNYFNGNEKRYNYFLEKLGPRMLFHLDEENTQKLINLSDLDLSLIFDTINSCKYDIVPSNIAFDNIIISLCDFVFKKEHDEIVNVASIIRNDLLQITEDEIEKYLENSLLEDIIRITNCDKKELLEALIDCRNLQEDKLRVICRDYLIKCEKLFLEQNKNTILNKFGLEKIYDQKDALKKLGEYYKFSITFEEFKKYLQIFLNSFNYDNLEDNTFIESIKMTKLQLKKNLTITNNDFNLICNSLRNNTKPDDLVKEKFRYFKMFLSAYINYKYSNEDIDNLLSRLNVLTVSTIKLKNIDMFEVLKGLDIDIFLNTVCNNVDILNNLRSVFQNKFLGRIPESIGEFLERKYQIKLPGGINNIGAFLTKYSQILKEEEKRIKNQGGKVGNIRDVKLSFMSVISAISNVNSEIKEIRRLIGTNAYNVFVADPIRNSSHCDPIKRQSKLVLLLDYLYALDKITIPSKDIVIPNKDSSKTINIIVGNRTNESNICHGEKTGACMRVGGVGEGLFLKCLTDKNWFHIRFEDPNTHEYISRVSGFRNGNTVYLNQLRETADDTKYSNKDLQEFINVYAKSLIEETKNSKYPIENVFINTGYAMENYKSDNGKVYYLGVDIKDGYSLDDVLDYRLRDSMDIWTDVSSSAILLATTLEGSNTKDGYVPLKNSTQNTDIYDAVRDKIYGLSKDGYISTHRYIFCDKERFYEVINRVHAMKEKLMGEDYKYDIEDIVLDNDEFIDGYASSDFYVYIDSNHNIYSDYIENIKKDNELIPYGQADKAKEEMDKYTEILKNKYMEVKNVI